MTHASPSMAANAVPERKQPSTDAFDQYETLVATYDCWARARENRLLPTKRAFETETLDSPEFLPNMTLIRLNSDGLFEFIYVGSQIVTRRNSDQTGMRRKHVGSKRGKIDARLGVCQSRNSGGKLLQSPNTPAERYHNRECQSQCHSFRWFRSAILHCNNNSC